MSRFPGRTLLLGVTGIVLIALSGSLAAQNSAPAAVPPAASQAVPAGTTPQTVEYVIHGTVKNGRTPLPGVSITAAHSLTGRKVISSTDLDGSYRLLLPGRGKWVLRAEFASFNTQTVEVMLTPETAQAKSNFELVLLSRVPKTTTTNSTDETASLLAGVVASSGGRARSTQKLTVNNDANGADAAGGDTPLAGMPALANSADAANSAVSVSGQAGQTRDFGLNSMEGLRDRLEEMRASGQLPEGIVFQSGGGGGEGGGPGGGGPGGGGPGGGGPMMMGGPGSMRMLRRFNVNQPHGMVTYTAGNSALDAAPYALTSSFAQKKTDYSSNRFGASIGGTLKIPHVYDDGGKTSYFFNYMGNRSATPYSGDATVPTVAERTGNFCNTLYTSGLAKGQAVKLYNPLTNTPLTNCDLGNMLDPNSPQMRLLSQFIPAPNVAGNSAQNYHYSGNTDSASDNISARLTHNFKGSAMPGPPGMAGGRNRVHNNINVAFNYTNGDSHSATAIDALRGISHSNGLNLSGGWSAGSRKLSSNFRVSWNRNRNETHNLFAGVSNIESSLGIAGGSSNPADWGVPAINFAQYLGLSDITPSKQNDQALNLSETLNMVRGKHSLRFGGDWRRMTTLLHNSSNPRGAFTFTGFATAQKDGNGDAISGTGWDFADFLLGYAQSAKINYNSATDHLTNHGFDLFVQDDWRARGNFTMNVGLRYEYISPFTEDGNRLVNLNPSSDFTSVSAVYAGQNGASRTLVNPQHWNFAPRIGLAWKPLGDKTVIRAGYGINYNLGQYRSVARNLAVQPPYAVAQTLTATSSSLLTLAGALTTPVSSSVLTNTYGVDPDYRLGYVQMWNLNVQRELTRTLLLNLGYTGSKGTALDMMRQPNRTATGYIDENAEAYNWETSQGFSIMHGLSVRLRKRMTHGFSVGGTYTFSKSIDNASSIGNGSVTVAQDDRNLRAERSLSNFDQRHKFSGDWMYELPFGTGKHWFANEGWAQRVFGDWTVSGSATIASGSPFTAKVNGSTSEVNSGSNGSLRANYNGESISIGHRSLAQFFNTAAFTTPASGTYGNAGRNTIIGPGSVIFNMSLMKNIVVKETRGLELRIDANNLFNHVNWSNIDTTVNSQTFGQVTGVSSMRKITVSSRFRF